MIVGLNEKILAPHGIAKYEGSIANVTHVHIPNIGLLTIDEVSYLEDCCTDSLQRELDSGWRILAVCPPNGTRRPDYILGRTKENGNDRR